LPNKSLRPSYRFRQLALCLVCNREEIISSGVAGIDFQNFLESRGSVIVPARKAQHHTRHTCRCARKWIELGSPLSFWKSVFQSSNRRQQKRVPTVSHGVVRIQLYRPAELALSASPVPLVKERTYAKRDVRFAKRGVERERLLCRSSCSGKGLRRAQCAPT